MCVCVCVCGDATAATAVVVMVDWLVGGQFVGCMSMCEESIGVV